MVNAVVKELILLAIIACLQVTLALNMNDLMMIIVITVDLMMIIVITVGKG